MSWIQLGGSIVAILLLAGFAWALGLGRGVRIADAEEARTLAQAMLPGFQATERIWLGRDGRHALVRARDGGAALVRPNGAHFVARRIDHVTLDSQGSATAFLQGDSPYAIPLGDDEDTRALATVVNIGRTGTGALADTGVSERA